MTEDHVDRVRRKAHLPHAGETGVEVAARIFRYCTYLEQCVAGAFAQAGLSRTEADLLGALLRSPDSHVSAGTLAASTICSTGTMTNRLDRLERAGMIRRHDDPDDRRGVLIELSAKGRKAIVAALAARDQIDAELTPGLSVAERRALAALLRKVLVAVEGAPAVRRARRAAQS
jgi:DNA-binding MarR family transcriptional regulator